MKDDPVITAIREVRHEISVQIEHDPKKLVAYYQKLQNRHRERIITETHTLEQQKQVA